MSPDIIFRETSMKSSVALLACTKEIIFYTYFHHITVIYIVR